MTNTNNTASIFPDYQGGSIVNLMRAVVDACAGPTPPYETLRGLRTPELGTRNLVLLVIDGLGYNYLQRRGKGGTLHRHLHQRLTSVFPSTTASAVTTLLTALAPQQHGLTGWHMYFGEEDAVAAVLPLQRRQPDSPPERLALSPRRIFDHGSLFDKLPRRSWVVSPAAIVNSAFNIYHSGKAVRIGYHTLQEMFEALYAVLGVDSGPKYIHAYYPEFDALAHVHGVASPQLAARFAMLDETLQWFLAKISGSDTTVLITADHGFVDAPHDRRIELESHPMLAATLARPLCGERRVAYCYVRPNHRTRFESYVQDHFHGKVHLHTRAEMLATGWFGPGTPHPRLAERIGDYVLVMRDNWTIKDWVPGEKRHVQIGVHGGLSEDEMYVPTRRSENLKRLSYQRSPEIRKPLAHAVARRFAHDAAWGTLT